MDNSLFLEAVKLINPIQLVLISLVIYYFYNRLDNKITSSNQALKQEFKEDIKELREEMKSFKTEIYGEIKTLNQRVDSLYQLIVSVFKKAA